MECWRCDRPLVDERYKYCPWCSAQLRSKLVEFFESHPGFVEDEGKALRVSRYLEQTDVPAHVRLSIWERETAQAAIPLNDVEARRLAMFLVPPKVAKRSLLDHLRLQATRVPHEDL